MRSEWSRYSLDGDAIQIIDGDRGVNYPRKMDMLPRGHCLFLNASNVTPTGFSFSRTEFISKEKDQVLRGGKLERKDIVLTTRGTVGNTAFYSKTIGHENMRINSGMVLLRVADRKQLDEKFVYWMFRSPIVQEQIITLTSGSVQPQLPIRDIKKIHFFHPELPEQKAIAKTISCLDAKIEVNNRIIKNLEEQAQAIFKNWFIDFEPFQDGEFVESELGMIPEGWAVGTIDDIIELHDSKRVPLSSREREGMAKIYPYYGAASLMDYVDDYIFDGTYLLLGEDGTVVDDFGYPILQYVYGKIWVNNHAHVITGKNVYTVEHLYMLFRNTNVHSVVTGAVQKKINQRNLKSLQVILPPREVVGLYNDHIAPAFSLRKTLEQQNTTLATLRDTLLPKLMSGEIEVPIDQ